jgi:hypothetical protein
MCFGQFDDFLFKCKKLKTHANMLCDPYINNYFFENGLIENHLKTPSPNEPFN